MASTIAHELNQPLSAIASYNAGCLNLLRTARRADPEIRRRPCGRLGAAGPARGPIIRRVHDFVRKSEPKRRPCALARCRRGLDRLRRSGGDEAPRADRGASTTTCRRDPTADRVILEQVLAEPPRNAIDAMARHPPSAAGARIVTAAARGGDHVLASPTGAAASPTSSPTSCSSRSSPPSPRAWAWASTSAARSSSSTRAACGPSRTRAAARSFGSRCPGSRMSDATVHVVDDDEAIRDALRWLLRSRGVAGRAWASAEAFLASGGPTACGAAWSSTSAWTA